MTAERRRPALHRSRMKLERQNPPTSITAIPPENLGYPTKSFNADTENEGTTFSSALRLVPMPSIASASVIVTRREAGRRIGWVIGRWRGATKRSRSVFCPWTWRSEHTSHRRWSKEGRKGPTERSTTRPGLQRAESQPLVVSEQNPMKS